MANYVDYCYSSDSSDGDYSGKPECLDFSYVAMDCDTLATNLHHIVGESKVSADYYESLIARHCQIGAVPDVVAVFHNLKMLDVSGNGLTKLPESLACLQRLACLVAKNNRIEDAGLLKNLELCKGLREVNLSGNCLVAFPPQLLQLPNLKFLFMGGNRISQIPREIKKLEKLRVLYLGGNCLTEIPDEMGLLKSLQALVLSENMLSSLPDTIVQLKKLRSLLLHKNRLTTLPPQIVTLKGLMELTLRDNPLVVHFVRDLTYNPPALLEMAARVIKTRNIPYSPWDIPQPLQAYLDSAHQCVNPKCRGVYFDSRVEHVKFVDFCGKYRIPLLQYLCSPDCAQPVSGETDSDSDNDYRLRKVLLG